MSSTMTPGTPKIPEMSAVHQLMGMATFGIRFKRKIAATPMAALIATFKMVFMLTLNSFKTMISTMIAAAAMRMYCRVCGIRCLLRQNVAYLIMQRFTPSHTVCKKQGAPHGKGSISYFSYLTPKIPANNAGIFKKAY